MAFPTQAGSLIRFGAFELDLRLGQLRKHGHKLRLHGQPVQVLQILVEQAGDVVSRETLRERLWPADTFVDFDHSLNNAVARIREALGDSAEQPQFVETIPRRGYRFVASVDPASLSARAPAGVTQESQNGRLNAAQPPRKDSWRQRILTVAAASIAASLCVLGLSIAAWWSLRRSTSPQVHSVAVLPFSNLSGDANQEYFADGMTEELITELGKVGALRVISHTSVNRYKGTKLSMQEIARQLQVDALVEGIVEREDHRLRVTANLVQAFPEKHLWAQSYDRDLHNILDLQSEIARTVAEQIKITVTPEERRRLAAARLVDPEAHELLLKGDFYMEKSPKRASQNRLNISTNR